MTPGDEKGFGRRGRFSLLPDGGAKREAQEDSGDGLPAGPGYPGGTVVMGGIAESAAQMNGENAKLFADKEFSALQEKGAEFWVGPSETRMRQIVTMAPETAPEIGVGSILSTFTAEVKGKKFMQAMEFGVDVASYVHNGAGIPVVFSRNVMGSVGEFAWTTLYEDAAAFDKALEWETTDTGYHQRYAAGGSLFISGSARRGMLTKIA